MPRAAPREDCPAGGAGRPRSCASDATARNPSKGVWALIGCPFWGGWPRRGFWYPGWANRPLPVTSVGRCSWGPYPVPIGASIVFWGALGRPLRAVASKRSSLGIGTRFKETSMTSNNGPAEVRLWVRVSVHDLPGTSSGPKIIVALSAYVMISYLWPTLGSKYSTCTT